MKSTKNNLYTSVGKIATIVTMVFLTTGCGSKHYTPSTSYDLEEIPEFTSQQSIKLENVAPAGKVHFFTAHDGDMKEWTTSAIHLTERELEERGMHVDEGASKFLKMAICKPESETGAWVMRGAMSLEVTTGDGYTHTYFGESRSGRNLYYAIDCAMMRTVAEMLRDPKIVAYLTK